MSTIHEESLDFDSLLDENGSLYSCKIQGVKVNGKIVRVGSEIYLAQDLVEGSSPGKGYISPYPYSWNVNSGTESGLKGNSITDFILIGKYDPKKKDINERMRIAASVQARKAFKDDDFVDVYMNAFESGVIWAKENMK